MKTRTLSIRIPVSLLTYCYEILKLGGVQPIGMPLSTAVVSTVERISASLIAEGRLTICQDDTDAESRLMEFVTPKGWAGTATFRDAVPGSIETSGPIQITDAEPRPEDQKHRVTKLLEDAVSRTLADEGQKLSETVTAPQHDTFISEPEQAKLRKLEDIPMLSDAECILDDLYSKTEDEKMKLALRIVYKAIPKELRGTETAYKLAYKIYLEHTETKEIDNEEKT